MTVDPLVALDEHLVAARELAAGVGLALSWSLTCKHSVLTWDGEQRRFEYPPPQYGLICRDCWAERSR